MKAKFIKTLSCLMAILSIYCTVPVGVSAETPGISAMCSILIETETGTVLAEKDADKQMLIASTTKILTALVVIENCNLDDIMTVKQEYTLVEGSSMYLKTGEQLAVRDVLYGLMLCSGNDAAVALACHTAGSVEEFAKLMNAKAQKLGMTNSSFKNPHGLDAEGHYSTARDMAILTIAAMHNIEFSEIVGTKSISVAGRYIKNHNKLLWQYDGALGVKTGYTKSAGRSLVSCVERDGMKLVCVTISAPDDWNDHMSLYDWAFENYRYENPVEEGQVVTEIPLVSGKSNEVQAVASQSSKLVLNKDDSLEVVVNAPKFIYAGLDTSKSNSVADLTVVVNGETVQEIPLSFEGDTQVDTSQRLTGLDKLKWTLQMTQKYKSLTYLKGRK